MNPLHRLALPCLLAVAFGNAAAFAQITNSDKTLADASGRRAAIQQYVRAQVAKITSDNPSNQANGRKALADGATGGAGQPPTPGYLDVYADVVNAQLTPLAKHRDMRVRLNAAIAAANVASRAANGRMAGVAAILLADKSDAGVLWGAKAGKAVLPWTLQVPNDPIAPALAAVAAKRSSGPVMEEVYDALDLTLVGQNAANTDMLRGVIPQMLRVLSLRVQAYAKGIPPEPAVDNAASRFLTFSGVWRAMTREQQKQTMQSVSELLSYAAQRAQVADDDQKAQLVEVLKGTGRALQVIGGEIRNDGITNAAKAVQAVSANTSGDELRTRADAVYTSLNAAPQFKGLKEPTRIDLSEPEETADPAVGAEPARPGSPAQPAAAGSPAGVRRASKANGAGAVAPETDDAASDEAAPGAADATDPAPSAVGEDEPTSGAGSGAETEPEPAVGSGARRAKTPARAGTPGGRTGPAPTTPTRRPAPAGETPTPVPDDAAPDDAAPAPTPKRRTTGNSAAGAGRAARGDAASDDAEAEAAEPPPAQRPPAQRPPRAQ